MQRKAESLQESEFLAENTPIEILPNFVSSKLQFISVILLSHLGFIWTI